MRPCFRRSFSSRRRLAIGLSAEDDGGVTLGLVASVAESGEFGVTLVVGGVATGGAAVVVEDGAGCANGCVVTIGADWGGVSGFGTVLWVVAESGCGALWVEVGCDWFGGSETVLLTKL